MYAAGKESPQRRPCQREARTLLEQHPDLSTRDGVHLGVMREHAIEEVLSYDRGFSEVPWVKRLEA